MSTNDKSADIAGQAERAALRAASAAGVHLAELHDIEQLAAAAALFDHVWESDAESLLPLNLARALTHAGNYCAGAYDGERLVGGVFGFLGVRDGRSFLHSHILAVSVDATRAGIGFALKQHQRAWALGRGIEEVSWTFDPLVRRNAYFNLRKLGASIIDYQVNFYGPMNDGVNAGDETDRVLVQWSLPSPRALEASLGNKAPDPDIEALRANGARVALDEDRSGSPSLQNEGQDEVLLCYVPPDIVALRRTDPSRSTEWRKALRATMGSAIADGYRALSITRSGWYVLERGAD